jgi:hypothetical protein
MFINTITPPIKVITAKAPFDRFSLPVDFSRVLPEGDTISTIVSVTASPSDLTVTGTGIVAGMSGASMAVAVALSGGSIGNLYTVTINITTVLGNQYSRSFRIATQAR